MDSQVSNTQFPVFKRVLTRVGVDKMPSDERVRQLCAQLLRAENPAVIETVAAQLKIAVDDYVQRTRPNTPAVFALPIKQSVS